MAARLTPVSNPTTVAPEPDPPLRRWELGSPVHATRNRLLPLTLAGRPVIVKYNRNPAEARAELRGHRLLRRHYPCPRLHASVRVPGGYLLAYQRLPISLDRGLLLDLLNQPATQPALDNYMADIISTYRAAIARTLQRVPRTATVGKLFADRAAPGCRLDSYFHRPLPLPTAGGNQRRNSRSSDYEEEGRAGGGFTTADLASNKLIINGREHRLDFDAVLNGLRRHFTTPGLVWAACTQGDPTDVNLAHPPTWLDFDTAGTNALLGEFAVFLWHTIAVGGWLAPTYNPAAYTQHPATFTRLRDNTPHLVYAHHDTEHRTLIVDFTHQPSAPRRRATTLYWKRLVAPLAERLWPDRDLGELLRPYLLMRMLAVFDPAILTEADRLLLIAMTAQVADPSFTPQTFFHIVAPACET